MQFEHRIESDREASVDCRLKLRYESPDTDEVRIVTVPMKSADDIPTGTLQSIAQQCGANDFHAWCRWINRNL
ncbi:type II toxin-antitoxin system HicA family toxin [Natronomonas gomsonensis]|uniref:type II toxin-antitoxin system HicA family toxin n=1 Tax=Natronomonas gomsonensis TaxID=1046043 RepID=UPI00227C0880|nr:type II toxin-antitoxin system HicA family toxin [Natronomonas gomsonensis]